MLIIIIKQKFNKIKNGISYFAEVHLMVDLEACNKIIKIQCAGQGFSTQGSIEEVPKIGYAAWKQGAILGIKYACQKANLLNYNITIMKIRGLSTDTNPTIVGMASILAIWQTVNFIPTTDTINTLEEQVFASWDKEFSVLPDFDN